MSRPGARRAVAFARAVPLLAAAAVAAPLWAGAVAPAHAVDLRPALTVAIDDGEPIAVAVAPDGGVVAAVAPLVAQPAAFPALRVYDAGGVERSRRVPRDSQGRALLPLAVAAPDADTIVVATADALVAFDGAGGVRFDRPAGDAHPDFGPAARGLAAAGDRLLGVDLAHSRLLGYDAGTGALRQRLGTAGSGASSFLAPRDVAVLADGRRAVADFGNRRLTLLDADGNPAGRWPLPDRPVAVAAAADGTAVALLADDSVVTLDARGVPIARLGGHGRGDHQLRDATDLAIGPDGRIWIADRGNRRLVVLDASGGATTPTSVATAAPPASATPAPVALEGCPDEPARWTLPVPLPPVAPRLDVVLAFDTTGSMEAVVSTARAEALALADRLRDLAPDVAIALVDVRDVPYGAAGQATDWPWRLRGALSTDPAALAAAAAELWAGGGGDEPEAYSLLLAGLVDDARLGWRPGARRVVALFGDSVPRDEDLNAGVADPAVPGIWTPGSPPAWRDSGPDWAPYSADDLDWQSVVLDLRDAGITLVVGVTGTAPAAVRGRPDVLAAYWRDWTGRTAPGGGAVALDQAAQLPDALAALVGGTGRRIARLEGAVEPPLFAAWARWSPPAHLDVDVPAGGSARTLDVVLAPPPQTPDGAYDLTLLAVGDGARYAAQPVRLTWRARCGPTATPGAEATPTAPPTAAPEPTATPTPPPTATPTASATSRPWPTATPTARPVPDLYLPWLARQHCDPTRRPVVEVVLAIDTSSSMAGAALAAATAAGRSFVDLLDLPRDRAAVVAFDGAARVVQPLTTSRPRLRSSLANLATGSGTRLDRGLGAAVDLLASGARIGARPVIVLLTDGLPDPGTEGAALAEGARARARGMTVFAVGLGDRAAVELLGAVAGDPSLVRFAPTAEELASAYAAIAGDVGCR